MATDLRPAAQFHWFQQHQAHFRHYLLDSII